MSLADKHKLMIDDALARLISRAANPRGLNAADIRERIIKSIEKYVLRDNENAGAGEIKDFVDVIRADDLCLIIACE
ncbi:MAG: hypothetical protein M3521_03740, partial [Acidobacteriota bacterium]|nr:hypothetical protein [Acidobacteriota bacterium]